MTREEQTALERVHEAVAERALSLTGASGGFAVPFELDPTIMLTHAGVVHPIRRIARVIWSLVAEVHHQERAVADAGRIDPMHVWRISKRFPRRGKVVWALREPRCSDRRPAVPAWDELRRVRPGVTSPASHLGEPKPGLAREAERPRGGGMTGLRRMKARLEDRSQEPVCDVRVITVRPESPGSREWLIRTAESDSKCVPLLAPPRHLRLFVPRV
jgi:hypothetical protein